MRQLLFLSIVWVLPAFGEFRIWEDSTGKSIEAEYVSEQSGKVVLKLQNGKIIRVNPATLSANDREYVTQQIKPSLVLEIEKKDVRVNDRKQRLVRNNEVQLTAVIEKKSTRLYDATLTATFIFIGNNERSDHKIIVKKSAVPFTIDQEKTLNEQATFAAKKSRFIKSSYHAYEGYLLVITDGAGEIVEAKSNTASYERHAEKLIALNEGTEFDKSFSPVDLNSTKTTRTEVAAPNTWLYSMGRDDFGYPQKSPDGSIARVQTRNEEAFLIHYRTPFNVRNLDRHRAKEINARVSFKLTDGEIGALGSGGGSHMISINDEKIHLLEIKSNGDAVTFLLDGAAMENVETQSGNTIDTGWNLRIVIAKHARLEISALDYQK